LAVNDHSPMRSRRTLPRSAAGYQPVRKPTLRAHAVTQPPPVPEPPTPEPPHLKFGAAAEDGLRMLAALETMDSLEPDFCGDEVTEASVTIIERADMGAEPEEEAEPPPAGSLRARLGGMGEVSDIDPDEHAAYLAEVEEASVEIVEVVPVRPVVTATVEPSAPLPLRPRKAHHAHRFFKALIGGDGD
jgi:hypothetical protein